MLESYKADPEGQAARFVQLDTRGRLSLQRYTDHAFFQLKVEADGTIVLTPADVFPASTMVREKHAA